MSLASCDIHVFDLASNPGLLALNTGTASVQTGEIKLIHLINLQSFAITLQQIDDLAKTMPQENNLRGILNSKIVLLKKTLLNISPKSRVKRSWDALGSGIKWITGNADADDLHDIDKRFNQIIEGQNKIVKENNKQIKINEFFQDRLNELSKAISQSISSRLKDTFDSLEMINLMLNIDLAQNKLEDIYEAITLSHKKIVTKNILEESEIKFISNELEKQELNFESTSEMFSYLHPEVDYNEDVIYYQISIPQVESGFEKLLIEPLTIDEKEIHIDYNEILTKGHVILQ